MDWSTEPYVRLYIRDTTTWRMLSWEAQAIFPCLMKHLDRAGTLDLDGVSSVDAVCAALPKWPAAVVEAGLVSLQERKVIVVTDDAIIAPKFWEAQNTPRADKIRAKEYRERKRDDALGSTRDVGERSDTAHHEPSRDVTAVTKRHSPIAVPVPVPVPTLSLPARDPGATTTTTAASDERARPAEPDAQDSQEMREVGVPIGEPTAGEVARAVELWDVQIKQRLASVRSRHTGSTGERVAACSLNLRTDEAAQNLYREVTARERGIDGVLEVLEWAWARFATSAWNGKQREEERKRIVFAFRGAATYWAGLVAERADALAKAEVADLAAKRREESERVETERSRASPAMGEVDIDAVAKRLRSPRATA